MPSLPNSPEWRKLLRRGLALLEEQELLPEATFGGGTALSLRYGHRLSWDVDLFLPDPQCLALLTPRLNDSAGWMIDRAGGSYIEQTNFLKLSFDDGEIDFIVAPLLTKPGASKQHLEGYCIQVEEPEEIIAKKLTYRGGELLCARDVFDLITVQTRTPLIFERALAGSRFDRDACTKRLQEIDVGYLAEIQKEVTPTALGKSWMSIPARSLVPAFLGRAPPAEPNPPQPPVSRRSPRPS